MLANTLFREIDNLSKHINNLYESIFKKYGLHRGQFAFITRIVENKSTSLKDLALNLRVDKTTVTKAVQKLEMAGYITKIQDFDDNRLFHLIATDKGTELYKEIIKEKNLIIEKTLKKFSIQDIDQLTLLIKSINHQLSN